MQALQNLSSKPYSPNIFVSVPLRLYNNISSIIICMFTVSLLLFNDHMACRYGAYNMTNIFELELCTFELLTRVI